MEDEARLENVLCSQLTDGFYYKSMNNNDSYPRLHGKILFKGRTCIDIFPLIRLSDNRIVASFQWMVRKVLEKLYYRKIGYVHEGEKPNIVCLSKLVSIIIPKSLIIKALKFNAGLCQNIETQRFINIYSIYTMEKETIDSAYLDGHELLEFEGSFYPTLNHVHNYLTHLYGDYMQLPPEDKRKAAHEEMF